MKTLAVMILAACAAWASPLTISDSSFETLNVGQYQYASAFAGTYIPGWTFTAQTGMAGQGTGFGFNVPATPDGNQAAFLQGNGASISQTIAGFNSSLLYTLNVWVGTRAGDVCCDGVAGVNFLVDGIQIGSTGILANGSPFNLYQLQFTVGSSGSHTLELANLSTSGDHTSFVDNISIDSSAAPEPATFGLFGGALVAIGLVSRRRR